MEKKKTSSIIWITGFLQIYAVAVFLSNIGPSNAVTILDLLGGWGAIFLLISSFWLYRLKKWAWYSSIISTIAITVSFTARILRVYQNWEGSSLILLILLIILPWICIFYFTRRKIKEQFK